MPRMRGAFVFAALIVLGGPVLADEAPPDAARYRLAPSDSGFTRLDTATGAITRCEKRDGAWACRTLADAPSEMAARLDALSARMDAIAGEVAGLKARLAALQFAPPAAAKAEPEAPGLTERLVDRLRQFVRTLKHGDAAGS
jgi:hypothetical protein